MRASVSGKANAGPRAEFVSFFPCALTDIPFSFENLATLLTYSFKPWVKLLMFEYQDNALVYLLFSELFDLGKVRCNSSKNSESGNARLPQTHDVGKPNSSILWSSR